MDKRIFFSFIIGACLLPSLYFFSLPVSANTEEIKKLQSEIGQKNDRLGAIEAEIKEFEAALQEVGAERSTLQGAINALELERGKVQADIRSTENQIDSTDLTINKLSLEIDTTESSIYGNRQVMAAILRAMDIVDDETMIEVLLRQQSLADFWSEFESLEAVKVGISAKTVQLAALQNDLEMKLGLNASERKSLLNLKDQYADQNSILVSNRISQETLLEQTRNEEAQYQAMLAQKKASKEQLLAEVADIESKIQFILDPNTIPSAGSGVFRWPVANPIITQYFGYTRFALSGAYNGNAHNGMDLGAPVGTKIFAPLTGTVRNIGDTDVVPGCFSWGKWMLIDHPNGLSTMYAHLSQYAATPGQTVKTGDVIGYIGNTGFSTGPHLHFTVYVSEGVQVRQFNQYKSVTSCGSASSPFAAVEAYLDPLDYLMTL